MIREIGFPVCNMPAYLSGEKREILLNYPELVYYRDVVFMFKFMMTPTNAALPEIRTWMQTDADLQWKYNSEKNEYEVRGLRPGAVVRATHRPGRGEGERTAHTHTHPLATPHASLHLQGTSGTNVFVCCRSVYVCATAEAEGAREQRLLQPHLGPVHEVTAEPDRRALIQVHWLVSTWTTRRTCCT